MTRGVICKPSKLCKLIATVIARNEATSLGQADYAERPTLPNIFLTCNMVFARGGCVYIVTNKNHSVLYTGVTSDIVGRIWEHKNKVYPKSFTAKYNCDKLVYYFFYPYIEEAIAAEKAIKGGSRASKIQLINALNPNWKDLYEDIVAE